MHFKSGNMNEKSRTDKLLMLVMVAKHVTDILAQKALDTFAKFLHAVDIRLLHSPCSVCGIWRPRIEFLDTLLDFVIPRNITDEIFDRRECANWFDRHGLVKRDRIQPRHAHQLWLAVDLGRTGAAFPGLAVPAACKVRCLLSLYLVHRIEHD